MRIGFGITLFLLLRFCRAGMCRLDEQREKSLKHRFLSTPAFRERFISCTESGSHLCTSNTLIQGKPWLSNISQVVELFLVKLIWGPTSTSTEAMLKLINSRGSINEDTTVFGKIPRCSNIQVAGG